MEGKAFPNLTWLQIIYEEDRAWFKKKGEKNNPEEAARGTEDLYLTSESNEERLVGE